MSLRIIAGTLQGRRLLAPPGLETRPLLDRIKQSLFDWLGDCSGISVADCCAGSGTMGLEAFSRGAREVHLIESGRHAISILQANLKAIGNPPEVVLHPKRFQQVLPTLHDVELIFCDPPFPWYREQPQLISELLELSAAALSPEGAIILRGERDTELDGLPRGLREESRRLYGRSWVALLRRRNQPTPASEK
jgi:16S rRNA (guanine966-N2)-methyltransferase